MKPDSIVGPHAPRPGPRSSDPAPLTCFVDTCWDVARELRFAPLSAMPNNANLAAARAAAAKKQGGKKVSAKTLGLL